MKHRLTDWRRCFQAGGLLHTSPGPTPGQTPKWWSLDILHNEDAAISNRLPPPAQPRRGCVTQPRVARGALPWVCAPNNPPTLKGLSQRPDWSIVAAMPQSLARILVHTVFSNKDRRPSLRDTGLRQELPHYLESILNRGIDSREGDKRYNPFRVEAPTDRPPRVARRAQPWAERCNPFGIGSHIVRMMSKLLTQGGCPLMNDALVVIPPPGTQLMKLCQL